MELVVKPEHNQDSDIIDKNNEELLKFVKKIFRKEDMYICDGSEAKPFNEGDFLGSDKQVTHRAATAQEEAEISNFNNIV